MVRTAIADLTSADRVAAGDLPTTALTPLVHVVLLGVVIESDARPGLALSSHRHLIDGSGSNQADDFR